MYVKPVILMLFFFYSITEFFHSKFSWRHASHVIPAIVDGAVGPKTQTKYGLAFNYSRNLNRGRKSVKEAQITNKSEQTILLIMESY
jgi:hypothetical protein